MNDIAMKDLFTKFPFNIATYAAIFGFVTLLSSKWLGSPEKYYVGVAAAVVSAAIAYALKDQWE